MTEETSYVAKPITIRTYFLICHLQVEATPSYSEGFLVSEEFLEPVAVGRSSV